MTTITVENIAMQVLSTEIKNLIIKSVNSALSVFSQLNKVTTLFSMNFYRKLQVLLKVEFAKLFMRNKHNWRVKIKNCDINMKITDWEERTFCKVLL